MMFGLAMLLASLPLARPGQAAEPLEGDNLPHPACGSNTDVFFFSPLTSRWAFSTGGVGDKQFLWADPGQTPLSDLRLGDFDGDGLSDVFSISGTQWRYSPGGAQPWVNLGTSNVALSDLAFGDFDGDGKTDIFSIGSGNWRYSSGGLSTWKILRPAYPGLTVADLAFGDFDGDGKTDVFTVESNKWLYSPDGVQDWQTLQVQNLLPLTLSDLRFGDFDGDGKTDVFSSYGGSWFLSSGGRAGLEHIQSSSVPLADLRFGDFDADGKTDVFSIGPSDWRYASAGRSEWRFLSSTQDNTNHNQTIDQLLFGNFDAAGKRSPKTLKEELTIDGPPLDILSADFNADGLPDLAASQINPNALLLWGNHSQPGDILPTFTPSGWGPRTDGPRFLASGDFNADGRPDLAYVSLSALYIELNATSPGSDSLNFLDEQTLPLSYQAPAIVAADFNGDGLDDLALSDRDNISVDIFLNQTTPGGAVVKLKSPDSFLVSALPTGLAVGDFNGDGLPDLASADDNSHSASLLVNQTTPGSDVLSFAPQVSLALSFDPTDLLAADLNQDGRDDLASTDVFRDVVSVQLNQSTPGGPLSFTDPVDFSLPNNGGVGTWTQHTLAALDLDQDGRLDLAVASTLRSSVVVLLNTTPAGFSTPTFEAPTDFNGGLETTSLAAGDFNQDGLPDLAAAELSSHIIGLLSNQTQPASLATQGGSGQSAATGSAFKEPLTMSVTDACGEGVIGAQIDLTAPTSGPSAVLDPPGHTTSSAFGFAVVNATANQEPGSYQVTASLPGTGSKVTYDMTNTEVISDTLSRLYLPLVSSSP
jgi:hypothetical protein